MAGVLGNLIISILTISNLNKLNNRIDIFLQPFPNKIKSYIRDDIHFLYSISQRPDLDTLVFTFDITNAPWINKTSHSFWIEKYPETQHQRFNKKIFTDCIELIRIDNSFQFNNVNYIQTFGIAMRTKIVSICATITFEYLEKIYLNSLINTQQYKKRIY